MYLRKIRDDLPSVEVLQKERYLKDKDVLLRAAVPTEWRVESCQFLNYYFCGHAGIAKVVRKRNLFCGKKTIAWLRPLF